jgi:transcriptional regulator with XRE-family HTH domain
VKSKNFASVLRSQRLKIKMSQESLANLSGLHRTYISQLERGERSPSLETVMKISTALKISFTDFAQLIEKPNGKK